MNEESSDRPHPFAAALLAASAVFALLASSRWLATSLWQGLLSIGFVLCFGGFALGVSIALRRSRAVGRRRGVETPSLALRALGAALICYAPLVMANRVTADSVLLWRELGNLLQIGALLLAAALPFLALGFALGGFFLHTRPQSNAAWIRESSTHFSAAGLAFALGIGILDQHPPEVLGAIAANSAAIAGLIFAARETVSVAAFATSLNLALAIGTLSVGGGVERIALPALDLAAQPGSERAASSHVIRERWHSWSGSAEEFESSPGPLQGAGEFGLGNESSRTLSSLSRNFRAPVSLATAAASDYPELRSNHALLGYLPFMLRSKTPPRVLQVGSDGALSALAMIGFGSRNLSVLEPNRALHHALRNRFDQALSPLLESLDGRIQVESVSPRAWLENREERYDLIQILNTGSLRWESSAFWPETERRLLTREGLAKVLLRLTKHGVLSITRELAPDDSFPRGSLRTALTLRDALEMRGIETPSQHLLVFQGDRRVTILASRQAFRDATVQAIRGASAGQGFLGFLFAPSQSQGDRPQPSLLARPSTARQKKRFRRTIALVDGIDASARLEAERLLTTAWAMSLDGNSKAADALLSRASEGQSPRVTEALRDELGRSLVETRRRAEDFARNRVYFHDLLGEDGDRKEQRLAHEAYRLDAVDDSRPFIESQHRIERLFSRPLRSAAIAGLPAKERIPPSRFWSFLSAALGLTLAALSLFAIPRSIRPALGSTGGRFFAGVGSLLMGAAFACGFVGLPFLLAPKIESAILLHLATGPSMLIGVALALRLIARRDPRSRITTRLASCVVGAGLSALFGLVMVPVTAASFQALALVFAALACAALGFGLGHVFGASRLRDFEVSRERSAWRLALAVAGFGLGLVSYEIVAEWLGLSMILAIAWAAVFLYATVASGRRVETAESAVQDA